MKKEIKLDILYCRFYNEYVYSNPGCKERETRRAAILRFYELISKENLQNGIINSSDLNDIDIGISKFDNFTSLHVALEKMVMAVNAMPESCKTHFDEDAYYEAKRMIGG